LLGVKFTGYALHVKNGEWLNQLKA
jgi:hypothetical protein